MNESRRRTTVLLQWSLPLALLVLVVVVAFAPGWVIGLIAVLALGTLGYGGVAWYYRGYQQFHNPHDHQ